jgi:excisionase family DNA binding protein
MEKFYSVKEVAKALGVSTNTVYKYVNEKKLRFARIGRGRFKIPSSELSPFLFRRPSDTKDAFFPGSTGRRLGTCITPNHNDAHFYHIFEGLLLFGLGLIHILTKGKCLVFS